MHVQCTNMWMGSNSRLHACKNHTTLHFSTQPLVPINVTHNDQKKTHTHTQNKKEKQYVRTLIAWAWIFHTSFRGIANRKCVLPYVDWLSWKELTQTVVFGHIINNIKVERHEHHTSIAEFLSVFREHVNRQCFIHMKPVHLDTSANTCACTRQSRQSKQHTCQSACQSPFCLGLLLLLAFLVTIGA